MKRSPRPEGAAFDPRQGVDYGFRHSMSAVFLARLIVSAIAAGQGVFPLFIDLNRTHATNPLWPGHARFHLVWQAFTRLPLAAVTVAILWWPRAAPRESFHLGAILTALPMAGFAVATAARRIYGGTLHDPNGIQPIRMRLGPREVAIDMNLAIVILAAVLLLGAVAVFQTHR